MRNNIDHDGHSFQAYFKRATSPLVVLCLLTEKSMYGYELCQALKKRSGGEYTMTVLYPVIYRLEQLGYVVSERSEVVRGRARSYYAITPEGRDYLEQTWKEYLQISKVFEKLMKEAMDHET